MEVGGGGLKMLLCGFESRKQAVEGFLICTRAWLLPILNGALAGSLTDEHGPNVIAPH